MGKATDAARELEALGPREMPVRPELKIRDDAPSVFVTSTTSVEAVISRMNGDQLVLRADDGTPQAVVVSPCRYAALAASEIDAEQMLEAAEGKIRPTPEALGRLMVEQVDETQQWPIGSRGQQ